MTSVLISPHCHALTPPVICRGFDANDSLFRGLDCVWNLPMSTMATERRDKGELFALRNC